MIKAIKYRLYPTKNQEVLLAKHFGCVRLIYNKALAYRNEQYKIGNKLSCFDIKKLLPIWKQELNYLKEVNSLSLQESILNLDKAFKNFFKKLAKFPRFKSKKDNKHSFCVPQNTKINIEKELIIIPKFLEGIKCKIHKIPVGKVKSSVISKTPKGDYYISITLESDTQVQQHPNPNSIVGIDLGIKSFCITSDNEVTENPRFLNTTLPRLIRLQQRLSKTKKASSNREKRKILLAKLHNRISNQRKDFLHKISRILVDKYETIVLETLKIKNMLKNRKLSKHIADVAWGTFVSYLDYKSKDIGGSIIKIDTFYPSSKTCSHCGNINNELTLSDRTWTCSSCLTKLDRDINAAINIKNKGQMLKLSSTVGTTGF